MKANGMLIVFVALAWAAETDAQDAGDAERFHTLVSTKASEARSSGATVIAGEDGWLFPAAELRHIAAGEFWGAAAASASRTGNPEKADPLPAILDFHRQLRREGIELWIVPVPPKAMVYPSKLDRTISRRPARLDPHHLAFYRVLAGEGITVIDLSDDFIAAADQGDLLFCRTDSHWSGAAILRTAERLTERIKLQDWYPAIPKTAYAAETREAAITGDLVGASGFSSGETLPLRIIGESRNGRSFPVEPSEDSPVLLLGDSHCLVFHAGNDMHARGAGLPDQLACELGFPVDLIAVRGSGATPARVSLLRKVRRSPDYLAKKKLIIWCFGVREFTESDGWAKVPVVEPPSQPAHGALP